MAKPEVPMHPKFAARIAKLAHEKGKTHGSLAVGLWWDQHFGGLPPTQFQQVMDALLELRKGKKP